MSALPRNRLNLDQLPRRQQYLSHQVQATDMLGGGEIPLQISRWKIDARGIPLAVTRAAGPQAVIDPLDVIEEVQLINIQQTDGERVQLVMNHADDGKAWIFDRQFRLYSLTCFLYDTNVERLDDESWDPHGLARWEEFYEKGRISQLAQYREILRLSFAEFTFWGGFTESMPSITGLNEHQLQLVFGFYVMHDASVEAEVPGDNVITADSGVNGEDPLPVAASVSREGAVAAGIRSSKPGVPRFARPPPTPAATIAAAQAFAGARAAMLILPILGGIE